MKQITKELGIAQRERYKSYLRIYKHKEIKYRPKILTKNFSHKQFNKWSGSH